ncbi:hypothetical protein RF11_11180 [Thelohanellus kitauei]|uniref:ISXO2-like transposase domain-containing protein n=1 Tax=Thelohanellus kitauei TaxID=669202 RepID=A0A0C2JDC0_THEKT|nr:hypothetical protein RF11_11180 [Thelohanellus kitauei]
MLQGDENIPIADREEWRRMNNDDTIPQNRNYGMRISGPWIFGLVECIKDNQGQCKSGEAKLFKVDRRDSATSPSLIRSHVYPSAMIWSDQWAANNSLDVNRQLIITQSTTPKIS